MKLNYDATIPEMGYYGYTKNQVILEEFMASERKSALVEDFPHKSAKSCYDCLYKSALRYYPGSIQVRMIYGKVYLFRIEK